MKDCSECIFGIYKDFGYSVYTVIGTEFICRKGNRKVVESIESYETIEKPESCDDHTEGSPLELSVDEALPDDVVEFVDSITFS